MQSQRDKQDEQKLAIKIFIRLFCFVTAALWRMGKRSCPLHTPP